MILSGPMPGIEEEQTLRGLAERWKITAPPAILGALLAYGRLLLEWNARINLTGADSLPTLIAEHFVDAFAVASRVSGAPEAVDIGSGGGLPAIPAALLVPGMRLTLVEPVRKKVAFLRTAIRAVGLSDRATVVAERLEDVLPGGRVGAFSLALSRATFHPREWLQRARPLVVPGGQILALSAEEVIEVPVGLELRQTVGYGDGRRWLLDLVRST
jgi:16S rRNA (guanine527-N7)-methyltransferase